MRPACSFWLPDLYSNQDKQFQKLSYYHYTIGQSVLTKFKGCKSKYSPHVNQISSTDKLIGCNQVIIFFALLDQYIFIV